MLVRTDCEKTLMTRLDVIGVPEAASVPSLSARTGDAHLPRTLLKTARYGQAVPAMLAADFFGSLGG
jgi:hypothetical protein